VRISQIETWLRGCSVCKHGRVLVLRSGSGEIQRDEFDGHEDRVWAGGFGEIVQKNGKGIGR
jgi:hypothetical protein